MPENSSLNTVSAQRVASHRPTLAGAKSGGTEDFLVVGLGASAGGLDACRKLVSALPAGNGMAFILVQHLDPTHESMMVELLAGQTPMIVREAADGMAVERDHIYVIPSGSYLSIANGALHLSRPQARHGARLPFDFLLHSMAEEFPSRAVCVILSGTGTDGSLGLRSINEKNGLVIAQNPDEAGSDGMPRSAIATGAVDIVLPVAEIPDALVAFDRRMALVRMEAGAKEASENWLAAIVHLLRAKTAHDFTLYKPGTLQRRIERRMALAALETDHMSRYLEVLKTDTNELNLLAKDLLINFTSFFRDPNIFALLAEKIVPDLVANHSVEQPLRIWVAGCSTGEETYSLAMLFHEEIAATRREIKLQVFASDVDGDAVAIAREGRYPGTIEAEVSPSRLARFFGKEDRHYRVIPALRASVIFNTQDVLADPPYSRLDMVSCRNLLIYLQPEAQAKVVSVFHFALREQGILLLGGSETIASPEGRFEPIFKVGRLYRRIGRSRPGEIGFSKSSGDTLTGTRPVHNHAPLRHATLAEFCQHHVMENYAPAAVLIDRKFQCLYFLGPTDRYLKIAPGRPHHDLLAMAREGIRTKLRSAIQRAFEENTRIVVPGGRLNSDGNDLSFSIAVQPVPVEGDELMLICFVDEPKDMRKRERVVGPRNVSRVAELELELEVTRTELEGAIHSLEISSKEQKAINEEALSVNEEFQSTNEELLTSKEELQSFNEELTSLNSQLREALERQRTTSNDLQNVLYSTDVATIFLDASLKIRFFTPATKSLFSVLPGDVGRPLTDLSSLAIDDALLGDAQSVLRTLAPAEREIEAQNGSWYIRRISPYRTQEHDVEGVVITFADITDRRRAADALEVAKGQAQLANIAKSRFLAAASHDLRQPLQSLALLQGLLARTVEGERSTRLVARLDETLRAMSEMLDGLLDINQIEAGTVRAEPTRFTVNDLFDSLANEFVFLAQARGIALRIVPCGLEIHSDPRLLGQMIRNLLSNALKYTDRGKLLLGCRRSKSTLRIEVWDTGIGIPAEELGAIFDEYHQLDNITHERIRGFGLGLAIVQRLGNLLGHRASVRSQPGKGSVFAIEIARPPAGNILPHPRRADLSNQRRVERTIRTGSILVVEDDPEVRELLKLLLADEGHHAMAASNGTAALELLADGTVCPDLVIVDYNLPLGMNGLQVAASIRRKLRSRIPVIILTGDISTETLRGIARGDCVRLNKPVRPAELAQAIQHLLSMSQGEARSHVMLGDESVVEPEAPVIFVVDDDPLIRDGLREVLEEDGQIVETYATSEAFLEAYCPGREACLLVDAYLPGMGGLELLQRLNDAGSRLPAIMITGNSDVPIAVQAIKAGASDFIEKPVNTDDLLASIARALEHSLDQRKQLAWHEEASNRIARLTTRQREVMELILAGNANKNIAADLGISQRTVENHRASIMRKTELKSVAALARLALVAERNGGNELLVETVRGDSMLRRKLKSA
jgi:two-component system, chemotaxis family, CheB/CheR fusion protein